MRVRLRPDGLSSAGDLVDGEVEQANGEIPQGGHDLGALIVDCESIERATEIALRWPNARSAAMEVRPVMNAGGGQDT